MIRHCHATLRNSGTFNSTHRIGTELDQRGNGLSQPSPNPYPGQLTWDNTSSSKHHILKEQTHCRSVWTMTWYPRPFTNSTRILGYSAFNTNFRDFPREGVQIYSRVHPLGESVHRIWLLSFWNKEFTNNQGIGNMRLAPRTAQRPQTTEGLGAGCITSEVSSTFTVLWSWKYVYLLKLQSFHKQQSGPFGEGAAHRARPRVITWLNLFWLCWAPITSQCPHPRDHRWDRPHNSGLCRARTRRRDWNKCTCSLAEADIQF